EERYYRIISEALTGGPNPAYSFGSAWTFNARRDVMIDEYIVDYEEYPAIGSGGLSYLDGALYVNTFSVREYNEAIEAGRMSIMGKTTFTPADRMRYRFMMQLFGLRLDKKQWERDFGCSVAASVPSEYAFFKLVGAIAHEDAFEITLTPKGRYLMVALMRQFFIGVNGVRDQARAALTGEERELLFGG
ncbi:MAG: coproporphyrinogen dehydrogenase, partial [Coriobacteriales bacterium]|nr:coproporphyrinogen dehydrogenase [Coriobacteriales bacterium]